MKNRYNLKDSNFTSLADKALLFFLQNPLSEVYLREYSRILKISPNTAQRFLDRFSSQGYILEQRKGNLRYFRSNLSSIVFRYLKIVLSLKKIESSKIVELMKNKGVSHLVLFGSVAEGKDDDKSDLDLVILSSNKKSILEDLINIQKSFFQEINFKIFSWSEWKEQSKINPSFYLDVITKGIALIGEKPVVI